LRQDLYRSEAIECNRPSLVGEALATHRVSFRLAAGISVLLAAAVIAFAVFGAYTRKERVRGYLAPSAGLIKVLAPESGTLTEKRVSEGQRVSRGDVLFVLSTERGSLQVAEAQGLAISQIESRRSSIQKERRVQAEIDSLKTRSMTERLGGMRNELQQLLATIALQEQRASQAEATATRYAALLSQHFVSPVQVAAQEAESLEQQTRLQGLKRDRATLERDINTLRQDVVAQELQAGQRQSQMERDIVTLDQERTEHEARRTVAITAPANCLCLQAARGVIITYYPAV
jgi:membrane fusion protein